MPLILVLDQGTHASRASIFTENGLLVEQAKEDIRLSRISHEEIEQAPDEILNSMVSTINRLDSHNLSHTKNCAIVTQRSTVVAWHADTGKSLSPAISWQDRRAATCLHSYKSQAKNIKSITGLPLSAHYGAGKILWLLENSQSVRRALSENKLLIGPLASFLLFNLIKERPYLVDHCNAHRMMLLDLHTLDWSAELTRLMGIPGNLLPECKPVQWHYGHLKICNLAVNVVSGDQNAALYCRGQPQRGDVLINLGSGAFLLSCVDQIIPSTDLLCGIASSNKKGQEYLLEGTVNGAGSALGWAQEYFPVEDLFSQLPTWLRQIKSPPVFINTVGGLGSPWWKTATTPCFIQHGKITAESRYVAIIESIVFLIQHNLDHFKKHIDLKTLTISGGLSQLDHLCQRLSNLSSLPVTRFEDKEATARGAAWLAAGCPDSWTLNKQDITFLPEPDPALVKRFRIFSDEISRIK